MTTSNESAVSWGAVIAGAVGAAALSLVLFVLGTGLGLAVVSPWESEGISGKAAGVSTIVWVTVVQLLASVLGGYLAGRLRTRWVTVHTNEVYFRDTAHGFLAWAVATLLMATLLSSAVASAVSTGLKAGDSSPVGYSIDSLFRGGAPDNTAVSPDRTEEVTRILANGLQSGELSDEDRQYLGQVVAANTGLAQSAAEQRVGETFVKLKKGADDARKASAGLALWLVVSLLVGAFVASFAATLGGRLRDSSVLAAS
ncbi:MAG TPA: hypothetical protein VIV63_13765 [Steroidobacteraceae bacterium]